MFDGCNSLKYLDISKFNMQKVTQIDSMFNNVTNLKFINLYNTKNSYENITKSELSQINNLTVCQSEKIIINEDAINKCCYYNILSNICENTNYIILYFGENVEYNFGFTKENEIRMNIDFIINVDHNRKLTGLDELYIKTGKKIEIYFSSPITSLENYFNSDQDMNTEKIISIDFSHFDSSYVENMKSLFYGCKSLQSILIHHLLKI